MPQMIEYASEPSEEKIHEAIALITNGLGKAELEIIATYTSALFWILRNANGEEQVKQGSVFFLDTGKRTFAVTAAHAVTECMADTKSGMFIQCMIGSAYGTPVPFHIGDRLIDAHEGVDIATLWFTPEEIQQTGREILKGYYHPKWPPPLAEKESGVTYCGYPGKGRKWLARKEISFGCVMMGGIATNSHALSLSILIERDRLLQQLGDEVMPENFDFGGMSGGPVLAIVESPTIRCWMPAGVIIDGPNPSGIEGESIPGFERIGARPIHFIKSDGHIDTGLWEQLN